MKLRNGLAVVAVILTTTAAIPAAAASSGPRRLQRLAIAQSQLLFRFYNGQPQITSPATCRQPHQDEDGGVFLLPSLSFASGAATLTCRVKARKVLVDLAGFTVTEDDRASEGSTWTLVDGEVLTFTRANLPRICDDVIRIVTQATATLDNHPVVGTPVITRNFTVHVNPGANDPSPGSPYYQDSIDLGHPGTLTACYAGYKALLRVPPGHHVLRVNLSAFIGAPTTITYNLRVRHNDDRDDGGDRD